MDQDMLDLYDRASAWTAAKVAGATTRLDRPTPCDEWDVRALLNHMLDTQNYFVGAATGSGAPLPSPTPPDLIGDDPVADFEHGRKALLRAFGGWSTAGSRRTSAWASSSPRSRCAPTPRPRTGISPIPAATPGPEPAARRDRATSGG